MHHLPSGENQRQAAAAVRGGASRTTSSNGSSPPSQAPAASRWTTCEASRRLGPLHRRGVAVGGMQADRRPAQHGREPPAQRGRPLPGAPSTASVPTRPTSRAAMAWPNTVPVTTDGVAASAAAGPGASASCAGLRHKPTRAATIATTRLVRPTRVSARHAGAVTSSGAPVKARGATATPNTSVPNADNSAATAPARNRTSPRPPGSRVEGLHGC